MKDLIQRLLAAANLTANEEAALLEEAADALERLTAGDVALPEPAHRGHESTGSYFDSYTKSQLIDYGNRRAAAAVLAERERIAAWYLKDTAHLPEDELADAIRKGTP